MSIYTIDNKTKKKTKLDLFDKNSKQLIITSGAECIFIKLNSIIGLKLFRCLAHANISYKHQKHCSKYDIAPQVLGKIEQYHITKKLFNEYNLEDNVGQYKLKYYGYITEVATNTFPDDNIHYSIHFKTKNQYKKVLENITNDLNKAYLDLYNNLEENLFFDVDARNIGQINGKWVCIDFGPLSIDTSKMEKRK
jgi:hypothetical protein